jgi:hypothetical protein
VQKNADVEVGDWFIFMYIIPLFYFSSTHCSNWTGMINRIVGKHSSNLPIPSAGISPMEIAK